jgi:hypothetical protein
VKLRDPASEMGGSAFHLASAKRRDELFHRLVTRGCTPYGRVWKQQGEEGIV